MLNTADIKQVQDALLPILEKFIFTQIKKKNTTVQTFDDSGSSLNIQMLVIEQMDKRFETMQIQMDKRFNDVNKRFNDVNKRFDDVNKRFDDVNKRFDDVNKRFDDVNKRFDDVDKKFEAMQIQMDKRFEAMQIQMDKRFEAMQIQIDKRFDDVNKRFGRLQWFITASTSSLIALISILKFLF